MFILTCVYNYFFPGTVYIEQPDFKKLIVSHGTETVLTSSMGIPQPLDRLSIEHGATVRVEFSLHVVDFLWSETSSAEVCNLIVSGNSAMTVTTLGDAHKGVSCNIEIEDGSALSGDTLLVAGTSPKLDVSGHLDVNSLTINNKGIFNVASTASINMSSLTLSAQSVTNIQLQSMPSFETLSIGYEAEIQFHHEFVNLQVGYLQMDSGSKLTFLSSKKSVNIVASDVILHDAATIDVSQGGELNDLVGEFDDKGASHGGEGGGNTDSTYGSTISPTDMGSGYAHNGGGVIIIDTATAILDGNIISDGQDSSSGGSILISATTSIEGHGYISASGGDGGEYGGGGGRIALITQKFTSFHGKVVSYGGSGTAKHGAAGTIYEEYVQSGNTIKTITLDNNNKQSDALTVVSDVSEINELKISGKSNAIFKKVSTNSVIIRKIIGDYTGILSLQPNQNMEIAIGSGIISAYALQCKLVIPELASAKLPPKLLLKDDVSGSDWHNLEVGGTLINLQELVIASGGRAIIQSTSQTGSEPAGTFILRKLDIMTSGEIFIATDTMDPYNLKVLNGLDIKYGGTLTGRSLYVTSTPRIQVAYNGWLTVDGASQIDGPARGINGAGGSYGGTGGASEDRVEPTEKYAGDLHTATEPGSVGGDLGKSKGGYGGGIVKISEVTTLVMNGKISADGAAGVSGGGGGSGGAISLTDITDISGSGTMSVKGGNSDSGGGGGGGRVRMEISGDNRFLGEYDLKGGSSTSGGAGGSGTASVQSGTILKVYINNAGVAGGVSAIDGNTIIDLPGEEYSYVDGLDIGDTTIVRYATEYLHFKAKTLSCGTDSTVVVDDNVVFSADVEKDYSVLMCSFDLYESGELRLPSSVELKGVDNQLKGNNILTFF